MHFLGINFQPFVNYFVWPRITDEGSVPEMRIWSILLIKSDLKWCIHVSRSLFLYLQMQQQMIDLTKTVQNLTGKQNGDSPKSIADAKIAHHKEGQIASEVPKVTLLWI